MNDDVGADAARGYDQKTIIIVIGSDNFPKHKNFDSDQSARAFAESKAIAVDALQARSTDMLDRFAWKQSPADLLADIDAFIAQHSSAENLIVFYVGHGGFLDDQAHYLALRDTVLDREHATALRTGDLATTLRKAFRKGRIILILDCCFAAAAMPLFQADGANALLEKQISPGIALLAASSNQKAALIAADAGKTMFSDCLAHCLREGVPTNPGRISLRQLHSAIVDYLGSKYADSAKAWPELHTPRQRLGVDVADQPIFPNVAAKAGRSCDAEFLAELLRDWHDTIDSGTMETLRRPSLPYSDHIIDVKLSKSTGEIEALGDNSLNKYLKGGQISVDDAWFIAVRLRKAIAEDDFKLCRYRPFVYPIHQYLAGLIREAPTTERDKAFATLSRWLVSRQSVYAIARDFAAFELGMCGATDRASLLLTSAKDRFETSAVRYYSILSIGMLGVRNLLPELQNLYKATSPGSEMHSALAHTILHLVARDA